MSENKTSALSTVTRIGGIIAALTVRDPQLAALIAGLAEPGALSVGHLHKWFSERMGNRMAETTINLLEQAEAEGIEPNPELFAELLENGLPFIGRASVEEKRRLMEEILMNGVRSLEQEGKKAEAIEALKLIEEIPEASLLIFVAFLERLKASRVRYFDLYEDPIEKFIPDSGMNKFIHDKSRRLIFNGYPTSRTTLSSGFLIDVGASPLGNAGQKSILLTDSGKWLADWITNNPAPRPTHEEAPPTE